MRIVEKGLEEDLSILNHFKIGDSTSFTSSQMATGEEVTLQEMLYFWPLTDRKYSVHCNPGEEKQPIEKSEAIAAAVANIAAFFDRHKDIKASLENMVLPAQIGSIPVNKLTNDKSRASSYCKKPIPGISRGTLR